MSRRVASPRRNVYPFPPPFKLDVCQVRRAHGIADRVLTERRQCTYPHTYIYVCSRSGYSRDTLSQGRCRKIEGRGQTHIDPELCGKPFLPSGVILLPQNNHVYSSATAKIPLIPFPNCRLITLQASSVSILSQNIEQTERTFSCPPPDTPLSDIRSIFYAAFPFLPPRGYAASGHPRRHRSWY